MPVAVNPSWAEAEFLTGILIVVLLVDVRCYLTVFLMTHDFEQLVMGFSVFHIPLLTKTLSNILFIEMRLFVLLSCRNSHIF